MIASGAPGRPGGGEPDRCANLSVDPRMAYRGSAAIRRPLPVMSAISRRVLRPLATTPLLRAGSGTAHRGPLRRAPEIVLAKLRLGPRVLAELLLGSRVLAELRLGPRVLAKLRLGPRACVELRLRSRLRPLHRTAAVRLEAVTLQPRHEVVTLRTAPESLLLRPA